MSLLATEQYHIMSLQRADLKEEKKRFDRAPMMSNMGMFSIQSDEPRAGLLVLQDVTTLVEYCKAYRMLHIRTEGNFYLFILSAFPKDTQKLWQTSYQDALGSISGVEMGSKIDVAFLILFAAFSTTSDKRQLLLMVDVFSYNVWGFKPTWRNLMELFGLLDHTVMTTAPHLYSRHCLEQWSDAKKIDFLVDMFSEAGQAWVLADMTHPGAALIITVAAVGNYSSTHMIPPVRAVGFLWLPGTGSCHCQLPTLC